METCPIVVSQGKVVTVTEKGGDEEPYPQEFEGITEMFPDDAELETLTVTKLVLLPVAIENPEGSDQEYPVALVTWEMEYATPLVPIQTEPDPVIDPVLPTPEEFMAPLI